MTKTHYLKCLKTVFEDVLLELKTFEYRKNDRDFQIGDKIVLQEIKDDTLEYTGREFSVEVLYILKNFPNLPSDYCIMSIRLI